MDNTAAYVSPPPLPPQAHLSAAFQAAVTSSASSSSGTTPFQEALMSRMGRPFGLTVSLHFYSFLEQSATLMAK